MVTHDVLEARGSPIILGTWRAIRSRSFTRQVKDVFEVGTFHTTPKSIQALQDWVDQIIPHCEEYEELAKVGPSRRILEDFAYLLAPLL